MTGREKKQNSTETELVQDKRRVTGRNSLNIERDIKNPPVPWCAANLAEYHQHIHKQNKTVKIVTLHPNPFLKTHWTVLMKHWPLIKCIVIGKVVVSTFTNSKIVLKAVFLSQDCT